MEQSNEYYLINKNKYNYKSLQTTPGPAYLMSNTTAAKLYSVSMETPVIHLEDVYTTGILAARWDDILLTLC